MTPHTVIGCMQATQAVMLRGRAEALLRLEVGEMAAKRLDGKDSSSRWRGRAQTIALLRERVRALHEQYAGAGAAAAQPEGAGADAAQGDAPQSAEPAALPVAAPRDRHDMQHRAHLAAMRSSAQVKLICGNHAQMGAHTRLSKSVLFAPDMLWRAARVGRSTG